jgi:sugar/nucleoside kinase (ribokinase family)
MPHYNLLTIGDVSIDQYMEIDDAQVVEQDGDKFLQMFYGGKIPVDVYRASIAGNSCNVAITTNKLGLKTSVYTKIGNDPNGDKFSQTFEKVGIDNSLCIVDNENATNVHTIISFKGERTILSHHPKRNYSIEIIENWVEENGFPDWLYYTSMPPNFVQFQRDLVNFIQKNPHKMGICFNHGSTHTQAGASSIRDFLEVTDIVFLNLQEAQFVTGLDTDEVEELHAQIHNFGPGISVITDSENGSSASDGKTVEKMGIYLHDLNIVDKTGAGDSFAGSFLAALHYKKSLKDALMWGAINSAKVITEIGAIHGQLDLDEMQEIEKIVRSHSHSKFSTPKI